MKIKPSQLRWVRKTMVQLPAEAEVQLLEAAGGQGGGGVTSLNPPGVFW